MILTRKDTKELSRMLELFYNLIWVMITWENASKDLCILLYMLCLHFFKKT